MSEDAGNESQPSRKRKVESMGDSMEDRKEGPLTKGVVQSTFGMLLKFKGSGTQVDPTSLQFAMQAGGAQLKEEKEGEKLSLESQPRGVSEELLAKRPCTKPEAKFKRGKLEIDEWNHPTGKGAGRIRTYNLQAPDEGERQENGDSAAEVEARAILKVEHLLANQTPGLVNLEGMEEEGRQETGEDDKEDILKGFSSRYRGVVAQPHGKWGAQIYDKHNRLWLGTYDTEEEAAKAHDRAAVKIKGNDAMTNFRPLTKDKPEGAFIDLLGRDQLIEMLRKHTFEEELANHARLALHASQTPKPLETPLEAFQSAQRRQFLFEKVLTPSDVGKLNRLVFPKHYAERFFPLNLEQVSLGQTLQFEDERGKFWRFRYSYWNSSQSYVLTKGWSRFVKEKSLLPGDSVLFEKGQDELLYIGYSRSQGGEGGSSMDPAKLHLGSKRSSSDSWMVKASWLTGIAGSGVEAAASSSAPRLFGVSLSAPPCPLLGQPLRTGSLPACPSSASDKGLLGPPGASEYLIGAGPARRFLSEGQAAFQSLAAKLAPAHFSGGSVIPNGPKEERLPSEEATLQLRGDNALKDPATADEDADLGLRLAAPEPKSQVKCFVEEHPYGVVVNLSQYKSTQQLKDALLSATQGQLVVYQDKEGDMIMLGDEEWSFFLKTVTRIYIRR